ncbi:MAG: GerMN domain-containing protein [Turicibacter sp.]|nr:GerMN domain-containing protein [Turicibacter sp.]
MRVKLEKLAWVKKITVKQVVAMCIVMVAIYFLTITTDEAQQTNLVGSMGYSYEESDEEEAEGTHVVYVEHESGYLVKTEIAVCGTCSEVESVFAGIQSASVRLPEHTEGLIPANAILRDYQLNGDILTLNLSESFLYYRVSQEENLLSSLVWSLTELPQVNRVHLEIEGEQVNNLNTGIDVGRGLTRDMGINLEINAPRVTDAQMMKLFFLTDDSDEALLVPVTRLVGEHGNHPVEQAVSELVRGPAGATYISVFNHQTTLLEQPKLEDGILTLNFCSGIFYNQEQTQVSSQVIRQLVMTMTEFEEVHEVSVVVEGSSRVFDDAGNPITVPVSRNSILENDGFVVAY